MPLVGDLSGRRRVPKSRLGHALLVALALCGALPCLAFAEARPHAAGPLDRCPNAGVPARGASTQAMRNAVVCLVNRERARYHLPPVVQVHKLTHSAQSYTSEMAHRHFFSHTAPNGSSPGARIAATGYHWSWMGENIAIGYQTPLAVVTGWMHSREHCYNVLAPVFRNIGVGVVARNSRSATWTQDFGLLRGAHSPSGNWGPADSCPH
jgi:uncharacterized protein YkwD